jgi:hypothetical protein
MIVALLLVWIALTAFAVSGLAWLEPAPPASGADPDAAEPAPLETPHPGVGEAQAAKAPDAPPIATFG